MENLKKHRILAVDKGSLAEEAGIEAGDFLLSVNGEKIVDIIDYEDLITNEEITVCFEKENSEQRIEVIIEKDEFEDLGLNFETSLMSEVRLCKNNCVFCFVDQMPCNTRKTLHVKDDDFRLSLIMGNYITLTNIDDDEFERIIRRHVSPLYISVHATDGEVRKKMMRNPSATKIFERLIRLKEENIKFNCQIVLCPDLNNGDVLRKSLSDFLSLSPESVAVVPVGLTKHREGLYPLSKLTKEEASEAIDIIEEFCKKGLNVYASDEMYLQAERELPPYEYYGEFPQIENGVGLIRMFEDGFNYELEYAEKLDKNIEFDAVSGVSAGPILKGLFSKLEKYGIKINTHIVENEFFGKTITVSGLICGCDIVKAYEKGLFSNSEKLLIPCSMLKEDDSNSFLDGMTVEELSKIINKKVIPMPASDGAAFIAELFSEVAV